MTTSPPPVFDKEKAKRERLKLLKGILLLLVLGGAAYFPVQWIFYPADTPLQAAVKASDVEAVRLHLGPVDSPDASTTAYSVYQLSLDTLSPENPGTTEVLKLVIARNPQMPTIGQGIAIKPPDQEFTIRTKSSRLSTKSSAVERAAARWSPDGVRVLLDHGLTIRSVGVNGALVAAAANGAAPIITMLLDAGADVNGRDRNNDTALAMARRVNNAEIVKLLLARGAREG